MITANSVSSGVFCVLPPCGRTRSSGANGLAISRKPSGTIQRRSAGDAHEAVVFDESGKFIDDVSRATRIGRDR